MQCPKCKADIENDSWYCDQCGEMIMMCPKCNAPRKGKRCTQCGTLLVAAKDMGANAPGNPSSTVGGSAPNPQQPKTQQPQTTQTNWQPQQPQQQPNANRTAPPQPAGETMRPQPAGGTMRPQPAGPSRMVSVDDPSRVVVFKDGGIIGRKQGDYLNVFSDNGYTSGRHAQLCRSGADWLIMDLGSTNGTNLDGNPLNPNQGYRLQVGQIVEIGYKKFKVE